MIMLYKNRVVYIYKNVDIIVIAVGIICYTLIIAYENTYCKSCVKSTTTK